MVYYVPACISGERVPLGRAIVKLGNKWGKVLWLYDWVVSYTRLIDQTTWRVDIYVYFNAVYIAVQEKPIWSYLMWYNNCIK